MDGKINLQSSNFFFLCKSFDKKKHSPLCMGKYYNTFSKKIVFHQTKQHQKRKITSKSHALLSNALENKSTIIHNVSFPLIMDGYFISSFFFFSLHCWHHHSQQEVTMLRQKLLTPMPHKALQSKVIHS